MSKKLEAGDEVFIRGKVFSVGRGNISVKVEEAGVEKFIILPRTLVTKMYSIFDEKETHVGKR